MNIELVSLQQNLSLNGSRDISTYAVFKLPGGQELRVPLTTAQSELIVQVSMGGETKEASPEEPDTETFSIVDEQEEDPPTDVEEERVEWGLLPDEVLSENIKVLMSQLGLPSTLTHTDLAKIVDEISERMLQQAEQEVPARPKKVPVGRVSAAPRRVATDEYGYPIVPGMQADVAPANSDEDGVGQL